MDKRIGLGVVAFVAVAAAAVGYVIARERSRGVPGSIEPQVERWEGEGGNVPDADTPAAG
ncbi:hypothetical protein BH09PSE6_BH09PSE6_28420 [soil metagenome]